MRNFCYKNIRGTITSFRPPITNTWLKNCRGKNTNLNAFGGNQAQKMARELTYTDLMKRLTDVFPKKIEFLPSQELSLENHKFLVYKFKLYRL